MRWRVGGWRIGTCERDWDRIRQTNGVLQRANCSCGEIYFENYIPLYTLFREYPLYVRLCDLCTSLCLYPSTLIVIVPVLVVTGDLHYLCLVTLEYQPISAVAIND